MILDATSYEEIQRYNLTELTWSTRAIIDGAVYNILSSFDGGKIMKGTTQELLAGVGVNWTEAASFPPARNYVQSGAVVNGTDIYFITFDGVLYKYDTILGDVTTIGELPISYTPYTSFVVVDNVVYFHVEELFYSFDGTNLKRLDQRQKRFSPGLFQFENNVCLFGGNLTYEHPDPVNCYNPETEEWSILNYVDDPRWYVGITKTQAGTVVFSGYQGNDWVTTAKILNHETKTWSEIPSPLKDGQEDIQALIFYA